MRILLLAPDLLGESLALQLTTANPGWDVLLKPDQLPGHPALVVWSIDPSLDSILSETDHGHKETLFVIIFLIKK